MTDDGGGDGVGLDYDPAIYADTQAIKGTGFTPGTDDLHAISTAVALLAGMTSLEVRKSGPDSASNDSNLMFAIEIIDTDTGLVPIADITVDPLTTVVVRRDRGGAGFNAAGITQIAFGDLTIANGRISFEYYLDRSEFMPGDVIHFQFDMIPVVDIGGTNYYEVGLMEWTVVVISYDDRLNSGAFTHTAVGGVGEQSSLTITVPVPTDGRHRLGTIWLELSEITKNVTIRLKYRIGGDVNYRTFWSFVFRPANMDDHLAINVPVIVRQNVLLTMQSTAAEAGDRSVDYEYSFMEARS